MNVRVWCGEEPRRASEGECLLALYQYLAAQPEPFAVLYDFALGSGKIDLVVLKRHGVFLAVLAHLRNGAAGGREDTERWTVAGNGEAVTQDMRRSDLFKRLRRDARRWNEWCRAHANRISAGVVRSRPVDLTGAMAYIVLSPDLPAEVDLAMRRRSVQIVGLPAFLAALAMRTSSGISLSHQEMDHIPRLIRLKPWTLAGQGKAPAGWLPPPFAILAARGHALSMPLLRLDTLDEEAITVGRDLANDLTIADPAVSRRHARLYRQGRHWIAEDLDSAAGTFVSLRGNPDAECPVRGTGFVLVDGSVVRFGPAGYTFLHHEGSGE